MAIFYVIGGALLCLLIQRVLYEKRWNAGLGAKVTFSKQPVLEGEGGEVTEVIENRSYLPLPYLNVKFQISAGLRFSSDENTSVSDKNYKNDIFSILFYQRITRKLSFQAEKRGYYTIKQVDLLSTDLMYQLKLADVVEQNTEFYVYPRSVDISSLQVPLKKLMGTANSRQYLYQDPFEFRGIRNYVVTDPMNSINWKASARSGELMVNLHDSTTSRQVIIFLNVEDETVWHYEKLHEVSIRLAAALSYYFLNAGIPTRIICNGSDTLTGRTLSLSAGSGVLQMNQINQILARLDLKLPVVSGASQMKEMLESSQSGAPMYILLANSMREELRESFLNLCEAGAGGLWILPLHPDMELRVSSEKSMTVHRWEVDKNAK